MNDEQGYPGAGARRFIGERAPPLLPDELARRGRAPGRGAMPDAVTALRRQQSLFVVGEGDQEPRVAISRLRPDDGQFPAEG